MYVDTSCYYRSIRVQYPIYKAYILSLVCIRLRYAEILDYKYKPLFPKSIMHYNLREDTYYYASSCDVIKPDVVTFLV